MFKKTKLAAATIALLSAVSVQNASAVAIDESGTNAQVLIFPYYNTNGGFSTGFNIRNTKNEVKAVKLRFRESKLSNDVLDFNVYMSPYDHFSVAVGVNTAGNAALFTADTTCTYPAIPAAGVEFKGNVYKNTNFTDAREGYLEVIEMGKVTNATVIAGVTHTSANVPKDCTAVATAWTSGAFTEGGANAVVVGGSSAAPLGISAPTGGLQGWSFLLDITKGNANVAMPAAIRNYTTRAQHYVSNNIHTFLLPSLASGTDQTSVVMKDDGTGSKTLSWGTANDYVLTSAGKLEVALANGGAAPDASGINPYPIAHVLAATAVSNDYLVTSKAGDSAGTDWVLTFPMRKHGIYAYSKYNADGTAAEGDVIISSASFYNREEQIVKIDSTDFSPVASSPLEQLPREVNVLSFGLNKVASNVLGSKYVKPVGVDYATGWGVIGFTATNRVDTAISPAPTGASAAAPITAGFTAQVSTGIPVIGFAAIRGNFAAGDQNVIGESIPHVFTRVRGN